MNKPPVEGCCPLCGGALSLTTLRVDLNSNHVAFGNKAVKVYPKHAELLSALIETSNRFASADFLYSRVWGVNADTDSTTLRTTVYKARTLIKELGWTIVAQNGCGYRLMQL